MEQQRKQKMAVEEQQQQHEQVEEMQQGPTPVEQLQVSFSFSLSYSQFSFLGFRLFFFCKKKEQRFLFLASIPVECCSKFNI